MKRTYTIQYDLLNPGQDYTRLIEAIKKIAVTWAKPLESCFVVVTTMTAGQIKDFLTPFLDANDRLFVMQGGPDWACRNVLQDVVEWLRRNVF